MAPRFPSARVSILVLMEVKRENSLVVDATGGSTVSILVLMEVKREVAGFW